MWSNDRFSRITTTMVSIRSRGDGIDLLPQSLGEGETEFEGHGEALEPLGQGWEVADGGDHFGDPVVDVGVAGAAPDLEERDLAVVEDDELDDRHAAAVAQHGLRQHI